MENRTPATVTPRGLALSGLTSRSKNSKTAIQAQIKKKERKNIKTREHEGVVQPGIYVWRHLGQVIINRFVAIYGTSNFST